jgi:hypothetical protein
MKVQCVRLNRENEHGFRGGYILEVLFSFAYPPGKIVKSRHNEGEHVGFQTPTLTYCRVVQVV